MKLPNLRRPESSPPLFTTVLPGFDATYYLYWYRDVRDYGGGPLEHYMSHGWREGRDPSAGFSTSGYLAHHDDVRAAGINPLIHFLEYGLAEGRGGWQKDANAAPPRPEIIGPSAATSF